MTSDLAPVSLDLGSVDFTRQTEAMELLERRGAYFEVREGALVVPRRHAADVADLLHPEATAVVGEPDMWSLRRLSATARSQRRVDPVLAPVVPRPIGWVFDALMVAALASLVIFVGRRAGVADPVAASAGWVIGSVLLLVLPIAIWGVSPGGLVVGQRVAAADGTIPGFARSLTRWIVPWSASAVPSAIAILAGSVEVASAMAVLTLVAWPLIHLSLFADDRRRGLHDRLAGTELRRVGALTRT